MRRTTRHASLDTGLGADSVALVGEAVRGEDGLSQDAVVGTYSLQGELHEQVREGKLVRVRVRRDADGEFGMMVVEEVKDLPGILDVAVGGGEEVGGEVVYAACAEYKVVEVGIGAGGMWRKGMVREGVEGKIALAVDVEGVGREEMVGVSDSEGGIGVYQRGEGGWDKVWEGIRHGEEAWSLSLDRGRGCVYSGGDDGAVVCGLLGGGLGGKWEGLHDDVGVTCVRREGEWGLWTGGYDDAVRKWDVRNMGKEVSGVDVGGGVWRVRRHGDVVSGGLLLVAAMYDGFKVVREESEGLEVVAEYSGHESLAYGAAWAPSLDWEGETVALTGSFYDHSLQLWSVTDIE